MKKKTIERYREHILLYEYDTPMQEAYIHGYWNEFTEFLRGMFHATFKTNPYLYRAYWTATSSNGMVSKLLQKSSSEVKKQMEDLLQGKELVVTFDEQIIFSQLEVEKNAIWSLLLASGYLKADEVEYRGEDKEIWYHLQSKMLRLNSAKLV